MKKIISLLLALMLICTFCTPAFAAEDGPVEYVLGGNSLVLIRDGKNYIISSGTYEVNTIFVLDGTLTIGRDAKVSVKLDFATSETVNVLGTLDLSDCYRVDCGSPLCVAQCCGNIEGPVKYTSVPHIYENGVCMGCGFVCPHTNGYTNEKCNICGMECPHIHTQTTTVCNDCGKELESISTGSVLSQGYPEIVFGIGGLAVGMAVMFFIMKKKSKPAFAESAINDDEE